MMILDKEKWLQRDPGRLNNAGEIMEDNLPDCQFIDTQKKVWDTCDIKYNFLERKLTLSEWWKLFLSRHPILNRLFCSHNRRYYLYLGDDIRRIICGKCGKVMEKYRYGSN